MADFCKQCSLDNFGEDFEDLKGLGEGQNLKPGHGWLVLCEGCGPAIVDAEGRCIAAHCDKKHGAPEVAGHG